MAITQVSIDDFSTWWAAQPDNTPETAYQVEITGLTTDNYYLIYSTLKQEVNETVTKYIDLSPSSLPEGITSFSFYNSEYVGYIKYYAAICMVKAPVIPSSVTSLESAFERCTALTETPTIPNSVTIMYKAFCECTSLTKVTNIPSSVTTMYLAFSGCTSLVDVPSIPEGVETIYDAFTGCTSLVNGPTLPTSLKDMTSAFEYCSSLSTITINTDPANLSYYYDHAFTGTPSNLKVTVLIDYLEDWQSRYSGLGLSSADQIVSIVVSSLITLAQLKEYDAARAATKQDTLVSGTNIKTINNNSLLGEGDLVIDPLPSGGTAGQILTKTSDGADWEDAPVTFELPVGFVAELEETLDPNTLFTGEWIEIGE